MRKIIFSLIALFVNHLVNAQTPGNGMDSLTYVGAGQDVYAYPNETVMLYGNGATSYTWQPSTGLSSDTVAQPFVTVSTTTTYTLFYKLSKEDTNTYQSTAKVIVIESTLSAASCTNWVNNGDMESGGCPPNAFNVISPAWMDGNSATADYYNQCNSTAPMGIPNEVAGIQYPHGGAGFSGLIMYNGGPTNWYEYIQQHLPCSLVAGQKYNVSFWASWANHMDYDCGNIGALLTASKPATSGTNQIIGSPQAYSAVGSNTTWQQISNIMTGNGESWLTIGNFNAISGCSKVQIGTLGDRNVNYNYIDDVVISPVPPSITTTMATNTICIGLNSTTFTMTEVNSPGSLAVWTGSNGFSATGSSVTVTVPSVAGTYTYQCTVDLSCVLCSPLTSSISITVLPLTAGSTLTVTPNNLCYDPHNSGSSNVALSVTGGTTPLSYIWAPPLASSNSSQSFGHTGTLLPGVYSYTVTNSTCAGLGTTTFTINNLPSFSVSPTSPTICINQTSTTLTASDPSLTYTWLPATGLNTTSGASVIANPTVTTVYYITGTNTVTGCSNSATATVTVTGPSSINILASPTLCIGSVETATLVPPSGATVGYTVTPFGITIPPTSSTTTFTFAPSVTTSYTVTEANQYGCLYSYPLSVSVIPTPTIAVTSSVYTVCPSDNFTLTASGAATTSSYTWAPSISTHTQVEVTSISANTTFTVVGAGTNGCTNTATVAIVTSTRPAAPILSGDLCGNYNNSNTLYITNVDPACTYSWIGGTGTSTVTCNPSTPSCTNVTIVGPSGNYYVTATNSLGCHTQTTLSPIAGIHVTLTYTPSLSYCQNTPNVITLSATGASYYNWSSGETTPTITVEPIVTTTYTVTGSVSYNTCTSQAVVTVTVNPLPTITVTSSTTTACAGSPVVLTASGSTSTSTYTWSSNTGTSSHSNTITVNPTSTQVYTVTGINSYGCKNVGTVTVNVNSAPPVPILSGPVCTNTTNIIIVTNTVSTSTYSWAPTASVTCNPSTSACSQVTINSPSGSYTLTVKDLNGCTSNTVLTTNPMPAAYIVPTGGASYCSAASHTVSLGAYTYSVTSNYTWNTGATTQFIVVQPTVTTTYTATATSAAGCANNAVYTITVTPTPTLAITPSANPVCYGSTVTLAAGGLPGGGIPTWSGLSINGSHSNPVTTQTLATNQTFTVNASNGACAATPVTITITVTPIPTLTVTESASTICTQNPVDYVTLSAVSSSTVFAWNPYGDLSCNNCASPSATPASTTIYTVTAGTAGCTASQTISVAVQNCTCNTNPYIPTVITSTSNLSGVEHSINADVTVTNSTTITDKTFYFAPSTNMIVQAGATLTLKHCHLLACTDMWNGITVQPGAKLIVQDSSLIEDAFAAISCNNWLQSASSNSLTVDGCVFNRNDTAISLNNYTYASANFPATIRNSVYTSRTLPYSVPTSYAHGWSTPATPQNLKTITTPTVPILQAPYKLANTTAFASTKMKNPLAGYYSIFGIYLNNIGNCAQNGVAINTFTPAYYDLTIGDGTNASYLNLFDELYFGIYGQTANFTCLNNSFESLPLFTGTCLKCHYNFGASGTAIYAINNQMASEIYTRAQVIFPTYSYSVNANITAGMPAYNNKFYDCVRATDLLNYTEVDISGADIRSTQVQPATTTLGKGSYGIYVSTPIATVMYINSNKITNINNGIVYSLGSSPLVSLNEYLHTLQINYNIITANLGNTPTTQFVNNAISCDNLVSCYGNAAPSACYRGYFLYIDNNTIEHAYRGIEASNWIQNFKWPPEINNNYISLVENSYNTTMTHFGINVTSNLSIQVSNNVVEGPNITNLKIRGVYNLDNVSGTACNSTHNVGKGFEFEGPTSYGNTLGYTTSWINNTMNTNQYGYCLTNNAVIGNQGGPIFNNNVWTNFVCDNQWTGTWPTANKGTYVDANSDPTLSPLYVRSTSLPYYPPNNSSQLSGGDYITVNAITVPTASIQPYMTCTVTVPTPACATCRAQTPIGSNVGYNLNVKPKQLTLLEKAALDSLIFSSLQNENSYRAQQKLFRIMNVDTTLADTSAILQNFFNSNLNTNLNTFLNIESALKTGDISTAQSLNNSVTPSNIMESNQIMVYNDIIKNADSTFNVSDSLSLFKLASSCAAISGDAVYQARILYNNIYNSYQYFENNCNYDSLYAATPSARKAASISKISSKTGNAYLIYPNPTTGKIYISGANGNDKELSIEILDITGRSMLKQTLPLISGIVQLQTNLANGVYVIQIKGNDGKITSQRLIVTN